jgi:hypothetical protein
MAEYAKKLLGSAGDSLQTGMVETVRSATESLAQNLALKTEVANFYWP